MAFTFTELAAIFPNQLWLEVSEKTQEDIWRVAQHRYSHSDRWTAYLNLLCANRFLAWLRAEFNQAVQWQPEADRFIQDGVAGIRLTNGDTRIVLIPDDRSAVSEFCIPQAWVDVPAWAADYYLAVQVNLEASWLRVWGYATKAQIGQANYETISRTYCLAADDLIADLNVLWVTQTMSLRQNLATEIVFEGVDA